MIRPTAVQLEHLWSTASSLDLFERILMKEDPHAFLSSNLCWPFWASELQTAFFDIGVVANPGLASDSESNKYLSAILGSDSKGEFILHNVYSRIAQVLKVSSQILIHQYEARLIMKSRQFTR